MRAYVYCLRAQKKGRRGRPAQAKIGSNEVNQDRPSVIDSLTVTLVVGCLQHLLRPQEMVVGDVVPPKEIQVRDPLSSWIVRQRRRLGVDTVEDLLCTSQAATS